MADSDTDTPDGISVEVTAPVVTETPPEPPAPIVVEPAPVPEGDSVDAVQLAELLQARERVAGLERDLEALRAELESVRSTASATAEVVAMEAEINDAEREALAEQVAEIAEEQQPPDIPPNNSHPWFRSRDEWMRR